MLQDIFKTNEPNGHFDGGKLRIFKQNVSQSLAMKVCKSTLSSSCILLLYLQSNAPSLLKMHFLTLIGDC